MLIIAGKRISKIKKIIKYSIHGIRFVHPENMIIGEGVSIGRMSVLQTWPEYNEKQALKSKPTAIIHNKVYIGSNCQISCMDKIELGENTVLGDNVFISDNLHGSSSLEDMKIEPLKRELYSKGPIYIGKNVLIGRNTSILSNVKIGEGAIIGANSVVTHDIPAYCVAVGSPAKIIKENK